MKIKILKTTKQEYEIELPITLLLGTHYLLMRSGGTSSFFKVDVTESRISYICCEPFENKTIKKVHNVATMFESPLKYNIVQQTDGVYISSMYKLEYAEIEVMNYILSFKFESVVKISKKEYESSIKRFLTL